MLGELDELHPPDDIFDVRELNALREMWEAGHQCAVNLGLTFCDVHHVYTPPWLLAASAAVVQEAFRKRRPRRPGRATSPLDRCRQDLNDFNRYDEVLQIREAQKRFRDEAKQIKSMSVPTPLREHIEKMHDWLGTSWERAYECASLTLRGTRSFGGPETVKRSYLRVNRNLKDPRQASRYWLADFQVERALAQDDIFPTPFRPVTPPMYELTL